MENTNIVEEIESGEESISNLQIENSDCDCPQCRNGRKHYNQILDIERYVEHLNDWD